MAGGSPEYLGLADDCADKSFRLARLSPGSPIGFARLLVDSVQLEEELLDRLTLAVQDGSDSAVIVSIAREIVEHRTRAGSGLAAANAKLPK